MIETPRVRLERISFALGDGTKDLQTLANEAVDALGPVEAGEVGGVVAATFSNAERFPSLAVRMAARLGLDLEVPAFDLQMACSAYPYAVYVAGRLAADTGKKVLVVNGDVQSRLVNAADHATGSIFSDAATATLVSSVSDGEPSRWAFLTKADEALFCGETGPIRMDGMKVFTFVATEVRAFLARFLECAVPSDRPLDAFAPHQANPYMVRQLAKSLALSDRLLTFDEALKNPGSCSVPLTLARANAKGRVLIAGFGAGYSASAGIVEVL